MSFHGSIDHFLLFMNNIQLYGSTTVYLYFFLLIDILAIIIWVIPNKASISIHVQVLMLIWFIISWVFRVIGL